MRKKPKGEGLNGHFWTIDELKILSQTDFS